MSIKNSGTLVGNISKIYPAQSEKAPIVITLVYSKSYTDQYGQWQESKPQTFVIKFWRGQRKRLEGLLAKGIIASGDQLIVTYELHMNVIDEHQQKVELFCTEFLTGMRAKKNLGMQPPASKPHVPQNTADWDDFAVATMPDNWTPTKKQQEVDEIDF